ncbi:MAG: methyltransferase [Porphyromonadaceae bacterium]|nr:methyltransferase [Porphyromonadaceae bacterium]
MSRDFHLKQFSIRQQRAAMKVGTDAIILGSWLATLGLNPQSFLDVGAGTGIIALMLAQRYPEAYGIALDLEPNAILDARDNISASPFASRLEAVQADFLAWTSEPYDLIVSNPPYFEADGIRSPVQKRQMARHEMRGGLNLRSLMQHASTLLTPSGALALVTPWDRESDLRLYGAEYLLRPDLLVRVFASKDKPIRLLSLWRRIMQSTPYQVCRYDTLVLRDEASKETPEFRILTKDYLLD